MLVSLTEWAVKNGIDPATARQRAGRGVFETAIKIGRNWVIDDSEKLIDHRKKEFREYRFDSELSKELRDIIEN